MTQGEALKILKTGANVFLTGAPGSGKTYTINQYVAYLRSHKIKPAITASTGVASTHIGGITIHSWCGIGIKNQLNKYDLNKIATTSYTKKRVSEAKVLIIDEVSMLPPATLQMVDIVCKKIKGNQLPFGGIQIVLVGDFFQLPPIIKFSQNNYSQEILFEETPNRFAFDSPTWRQAELSTCYITEQYRQDDNALLLILSKIRGNNFDKESLAQIKMRKINPLYVPAGAPKLYSHNVNVDFVNNQMLEKIEAKPKLFRMQTRGHRALVMAMKKGCLSPENLYLKIGACVMFTKNDQKNGFINGTLGTVVGYDIETNLPIVQIKNGKKIIVSSAEWTVEENGKIKGSITQIPLRLAWAITVHKSQGVSLDEAVIDLSKVFEFGQGYVALSRVRRLSGVHLLGWNSKAFQVSNDALKKDREFQAQSIETEKMLSRFSEDELVKTANDFILSCDGKLDTSKVAHEINENKTDTYRETLKFWNQGMGIEQIAKMRNLTQGTILCHIENLINTKKIEKDVLARIVPLNIFHAIPQIHSVFKKLDTKKLSPVFEFFNGKYSYDELRIAKLMLK